MFRNDPRSVRTPEIRLSYVHLATPWANPNQTNATPKYSVVMLIPKSNTALLEEIKASIRAAAQEAAQKVWGGFMLPDNILFSIIHDGDMPNNNGKSRGPEAAGCWVISATSQAHRKPYVCAQSNINVALEDKEIYSGMYGQCVIQFYGTNNGGNKLCCGLQSVMKTRDGEPLGAAGGDANDFADVGISAASDFAAVGQAVANAPTANGPAVNPVTGQPVGAAPAINPITGLPM